MNHLNTDSAEKAFRPKLLPLVPEIKKNVQFTFVMASFVHQVKL